MSAALLERDLGIAVVEEHADERDRAAIDDAIAARVRAGRPFTANDCRDELAGVRPALIGARFLAAAKRGDIVPTGYVRSTSPQTHGAVVRTWTPAWTVAS